MKMAGYVRVSSKEQHEDRQLVALLNFGVLEKNIYIDKISGKDFNRPRYKKMIRQMKSGDVLVIKSIDRLGRNYQEILEQWRIITKEKSIDIVVLDMPLLDTRENKDLLGTFIADLILQVLSYVSQTEREFIKQRQKEGIAIAKAKGVRFGRPKKAIPEEFNSFRIRFNNHEISARQAAKALAVSHHTFLRWVNQDSV